VKLLSKFNKEGSMRQLHVNRIQLLTRDVPTTFREFETDYRDQDKPDLEEAFYCLDDRERNLKEKTSCVQYVTTYLAKSRENLLDLLAHNTFNECAKASKQIGQNLYKKINSDPRNSEDIRCGFKVALRCLEAAVYLLMDVLKAHSQRSTEKLANMSVVSSYHSTTTQARDTAHPPLHRTKQHPPGLVQARRRRRAADPIMERQEKNL
jgi:hypothetical protein